MARNLRLQLIMDAAGNATRFLKGVRNDTDATSKALRAARDQAERAARIVRAKRQEGASDSLEWLDAERTFAETEAVLAAQDGQISRRQIALFRALAGGWSS